MMWASNQAKWVIFNDDAPWPYPAFGELVAIWLSQDKTSIPSLRSRGAVGKIIALDTMGNHKTVILVAEFKYMKGLNPKALDPNTYRMGMRWNAPSHEDETYEQWQQRLLPWG